MGHYDSCYEADDRAKDKRRNKDARYDLELALKNNIDDLGLYEMQFLTKIIENLDSYINFFEVIERHTNK